jgi:hypothetical protein
MMAKLWDLRTVKRDKKSILKRNDMLGFRMAIPT